MFLPGPTGIGGLLLFFILTQFISLVWVGSGTAAIVSQFQSDAWALGDRVHLYRPFVVVEAFAHVIRMVGPVIGLVLIFRRDHRTRSFYTAYLLFVAAFGAFEWVAVTVTYPQLEPLIVAAGHTSDQAREMRLNAFMDALRTCAYGTIWLWYWRESARVANTFPASHPPA